MLVFQFILAQKRNVINLSDQTQTLKCIVYPRNGVEGKRVGRKKGSIEGTDLKKGKGIMLNLLKCLDPIQCLLGAKYCASHFSNVKMRKTVSAIKKSGV